MSFPPGAPPGSACPRRLRPRTRSDPERSRFLPAGDLLNAAEGGRRGRGLQPPGARLAAPRAFGVRTLVALAFSSPPPPSEVLMPAPVSGMRRSLYREFRRVFILITVCVTIAAIPAFVLTELSTGSGGAINVSGSLRMMSYRLAVSVSNPYYETPEARERATVAAVNEFWDRLTRPVLTQSIPASQADSIRRLYQKVERRFVEEVRPAALASVRDESGRRRFMEAIGGFVADVDDFVAALEASLSGRMRWLKGILFFTLLGAVCVTFLLLRVMRLRIFEPLEELERAAGAVRGGDFTVRARAAAHDSEIGRFARGFNFMVRELERLYGSLEAEVARKTEDLNRRNRGLEFLAGATETMQAEGPRLAAAVRVVLEGAAALAEARSAEFLADRAVGADGGEALCSFASAGESAPGDVLAEFPAYGPGGRTGVLRVTFERMPADWQRNFLDMTAALIGRAVESSLRATDDKRLAVLEERATIARELHDSIAQSLSFSKIQLLRLRRAVAADPSGERTREALSELDEGISTAYRQLREVLTAFRLQLGEGGFAESVADAVEVFRTRTGMEATLVNTLIGVELSSNEQVHVVQILREALSNVEKHARARSVEVRLERTAEGGCVLTIVDDGVGIPQAAEKARHFGLGIMRERAEALGAEISIRRRAESGGTVVTIVKPGPERSGGTPAQ